MKKSSRWLPWFRLYLWLQAIGTAIFYLIMWRRVTIPRQDFIGPPDLQASEPASTNATNHPLVSIIVPARNEERNILRCVESLLEQDYERFEVIAINDDSTDATGSILEDIAAHHPRGQLLHILHLHELPQGWTGKTHAVHCGVQQARGDWLLLTDADTWHSPPALHIAIARAIEENTDLLTISPIQELVGFWNKVLMPMTFIGYSIQYSPSVVSDPDSRVAIANGQFILLRRSVYDATGGLARPEVRDAHPEDRALAMAVKSSGFRLRSVVDSGLVHAYMYSGFAEIWHGFTRLAKKGIRSLPFFFLMLFGLPHISILPCLLPLLLWLTRRGKRGTKEGIHPLEAGITLGLQWTSILAFHSWFYRVLRISPLYALTQPLAGSVFTCLLIRSLWRRFTGKTSWRGRQYSQQKTSEKGNLEERQI